MKIAILADSLALPRPEGEGNISYESTYPYLLIDSLRRQFGAQAPLIIEGGRRRRTIEYVLDDWQELVELRGADVVIVHVGIVDCAPRVFLRREASAVARVRPVKLRDFIFSFVHKHRRRIVTLRKKVYVPADRFRRHVRETIGRARRDGLKSLVFVNIITPPVEMEERSPGFQRNVAIYNRVLEEEANEPWIHLIDMNGLVEKEGGVEKLLFDGIHINEAGHELLARELETHILSVFGKEMAAAPQTSKV